MIGAIITGIVTVAALAALFIGQTVTGPAMQEWRERR